MPKELADASNVGENQGVLITDVMAGGPSERAGVRPGDILVNVEFKTIVVNELFDFISIEGLQHFEGLTDREFSDVYSPGVVRNARLCQSQLRLPQKIVSANSGVFGHPGASTDWPCSVILMAS